MNINFEAADLVTIGLLVLLEGLLSADNALVLAILVLGLPQEQQKQALRWGIAGAFVFRAIAILLVGYLMRVAWVKLAGGLYLGYLAWAHFMRHKETDDPHAVPKATSMFGLSPFWSTVVRVEAVDIAFSVDSILVAVALSPKTWVVVTGGVLGIIMMRLVAGSFIQLIRRYPTLVDGAFVIIGWVAIKLIAEYAHNIHLISWQIPKTISLGLIVVIFLVAFAWAKRKEARDKVDTAGTPPTTGDPTR